jgi:uncharacterized phage-associated protein
VAAGYNVRKAAQVVAFLVREQGDPADRIKTVKLIYLADRRFLELYDLPILNDDFCSMEHGPVDSMTYNLIKGSGAPKARKTWESYVRTRQNAMKLAYAFSDEDFDELSPAETTVLKEVVSKFKHLKPFQLVKYVHDNCSEWENVGKTSKYLSYERVFNALGKSNSNELTDRIYEYGNLEEAFAQAK